MLDKDKVLLTNKQSLTSIDEFPVNKLNYYIADYLENSVSS